LRYRISAEQSDIIVDGHNLLHGSMYNPESGAVLAFSINDCTNSTALNIKLGH
jgi:hypothetical protein